MGFGMAWSGSTGRSLGGVDCESFGAEGEGKPPLATNLSFLNSAERSEALLQRPEASRFCLPKMDENRSCAMQL